MAVAIVRMNRRAAQALGDPTGLDAALPEDLLAPKLRGLIAEGLVRREGVLVFARHADEIGNAPGNSPDLTGWECSVNTVHLDFIVPIAIGSPAAGEPVIDDDAQVHLLRHGLGLAVEIVRLAGELDGPVPVRCIIGANSTSGTFRFHRVRPGETWLVEDLDAYRGEMVAVVESTP